MFSVQVSELGTTSTTSGGSLSPLATLGQVPRQGAKWPRAPPFHRGISRCLQQMRDPLQFGWQRARAAKDHQSELGWRSLSNHRSD